jgi:hypothetical protein
MSFGECLFLQGVIGKEPKDVHMSDLHREKRVTYKKKNNLEDSGSHPLGSGTHLSL